MSIPTAKASEIMLVIVDTLDQMGGGPVPFYELNDAVYRYTRSVEWFPDPNERTWAGVINREYVQLDNEAGKVVVSGRREWRYQTWTLTPAGKAVADPARWLGRSRNVHPQVTLGPDSFARVCYQLGRPPYDVGQRDLAEWARGVITDAITRIKLPPSSVSG